MFGLEIDLSKIHKIDIPPERGLAVSRRYVKLGERQGSRVAIVEGVEPGELVVTAGQLKLNNGTRVEVIEQAP